MTEAEWLASDDAFSLLEFLRSGGHLSDRKVRLFVAACCRPHWERLRDQRSRAAILAAESYADGHSDGEALLAAARDANEACYLPDGQKAPEPALSAAHLSTYAPHTIEAFTNPPDRARPGSGGYATEAFDKPEGFAELACLSAADGAATAAGFSTTAEWEVVAGDEFRRQADLLRDIFGNPFRAALLPTVGLGIVASLALAAYDEREFPSGHLEAGRLGVLADALEEAGCTDPNILGHFRGTGPHVRGCWPLDLCLGKS